MLYTPVRKAFYQLAKANVVIFFCQLVSLYIMTQYYSKQQIADLTIFVAVVFLLSKFSNLKLFEGIIRETNQEVAQKTFRSAMTLSLFLAVMISVLFTLCNLFGLHFHLFYAFEIGFWILIVLFSIHLICTSLLPIVSSYLLRKEQFTALTTGRVIKGIIQIALLMVFIETLDSGLIAALVLSTTLQLIITLLLSSVYKEKLFVSLQQVKQSVKANSDLIKYTLPTSLLLSLRENGIVQILQMTFGEAALAAYGVADRILRIPSSIVGSAASETLYKYGSDTFFMQSPNLYWRQLKRGFIRLVGVFTLIAISCFLLAHPVLSGLFDTKWIDAEQILRHYAIWIIPFSILAIFRIIPVMLRQQRIYFVLELLLCLGTIVLVYLASKTTSFEQTLMVKYLVEAFIMTLLIGYILVMVSRQTKSEKAD